MIKPERLILLLIFIFYSISVQSQKLIAYYPFNNNATDLCSYKNNGQITGGVTPTEDRFGNPCGALYFNGTDGYIEVPNSSSLQSIVKSYTVLCWVKLDNIYTPGELEWLTIICKGSDAVETPNNPQYRVQTFQSATQSTISINTDFTEYDNDFANHRYETGKWFFYALVYDGKNVRAYINDNKIWEFPYDKRLEANNEPLHIAKDIPGATEYFKGALDDLRIYDGALPEKIIFQLFNDNSGSSYDDVFKLTCPQNITKNNEKGECYATVTYEKPVIDINCGTGNVTQIAGLPSGSEFPIGNNDIVFEALSSTGLKKTCFSKVIIKDNEAPTIKCPKDTVLTVNDPNIDGVKFEYNLPEAIDNCKIKEVKLTSGLNSDAIFPEGNNELQFSAIDENGNKSECSYNVIVKKSVKKVLNDTLICPKDIIKVNDQNKCGAIVNYNVSDRTTNSNPNIKLSEGIESGSFFPVGTTTNKYKKVLINGSTAECVFNVIITDKERPEIICPNDTILYCDKINKGVIYTYNSPIATDNCRIGKVNIKKGKSSGEFYPVGITDNIYEAYDIYGNTGTCSFKVTVVDTSKNEKKPEDTIVKKDIIEDTIIYDKGKDIVFKDCIITLVMYDDNQQDNDTVSVFFNGKEIVKRELIKLKQNGTILRAVMLNPDEKNEVIVKAWNYGKIRPNTLRIDFYEGYYINDFNKIKNKKPEVFKIIHSKPGYAGAIKLKCNYK